MMNGNIQTHDDSSDIKLSNELKLLEELSQKLLVGRHDPELFAPLARLARSMRLTTKRLDSPLAEHVAQLEGLLNGWMVTRRTPRDEERGQYRILLENIRQQMNHQRAGNCAEPFPANSATVARPRVGEVYVVDPRDMRALLVKLDEAGFAVRQFRDPANAETALNERTPLATIIHVGSFGKHLEGIEMIARMQDQVQIEAPVFFTAKRDDFDTRLAAVRAGGTGFFVEPLDYRALLEQLNGQLNLGPKPSRNRVLIVDETPDDARNLAATLASQGFVTRVVCEPRQVLRTLRDFQPDLILLDLDSRKADGVELIRLLSQHETCAALPIILLTAPENLPNHLARLGSEADDLLIKPVEPSHLQWTIRLRLEQTRTIHHQLAALGRRDAATGLFSRQYFLGELEHLLLTPSARSPRVGVMLVMLENWRNIRETTDAATADEVIRRVARHLQRVPGLRRKLARFGDALFAVLMQDSDREALLAKAREVSASLGKRVFKVGFHKVQVRTCIGISVAEEGDQDFLRLIQQADLACSLAKEIEGESIHVHDSAIDRKFKATRQRHLLDQVSEALLYGRLHLLFQPIVSLRNRHHERYEVFLRLQDKEGQDLLPETVFDVTYEHALGARLDGWVVNRSLELLAAQQARGMGKTLFINLSPMTLQSAAVRPWLRERLEKSQVDPRQLVFEVSERTARQHLKDLRGFMAEFRDLGCGFSLERFGSRPDSILLLDNLAVNYVKFDSRFVHGLQGTRAHRIKQQLEVLASKLNDRGVVVVMIGIEDTSSLSMLWSCGVECVQGFLLQRPSEEMVYDFSVK